jgi:hypothetical protein
MASDYKGDDIDDLRREEERRGKRGAPSDKEKLKQQHQRERDSKELLRSMNWKQVERVLAGGGITPGTPEYEKIASTWRAYQSQRLSEEKQARPRRPGRP